MNTFSVIIPGKPIPLQRSRFAKGRTYDPQASIKEDVYWTICSVLSPNYPRLTKQPCFIDFKFFFEPPKSLSKKKKAELFGKPHTSKPDIDNLIKFYLDVCNALLYYDDAQVHTVNAIKQYALTPQTIITIHLGDDNETN